MPSFRCQTIAGGGGIVIDAPDRASAIREATRLGQAPVRVEPVTPESSPEPKTHVPAPLAFRRRVMSRGETASFIRELATAVLAGLPLVTALRTLARQGRSARQRAMIDSIMRRLEHGESLGDAAQAWGAPFSELTISLIRAGEVSGRLGEVLMQAADLLDRDVKLRRSLLAATLYPMILAGLVVVSIIVIVTFIVPKLIESFNGAPADFPWPTRVVLGVADFFKAWWWAIVPAAALAVAGVSRLMRSPGPRLTIDAALLKVPILGPMLRDVAVARFTRTLATLTGAGIPAVSALRATRPTLGNRAMERVIDEVCDRVSAGTSIADPMEQSGHFPPMLVQIVGLGERSGRLDELLGQAAGAFEDRTESSIKLFTTALPPVLVVVMAGVVGFVILAVLLALLTMQESLG